MLLDTLDLTRCLSYVWKGLDGTESSQVDRSLTGMSASGMVSLSLLGLYPAATGRPNFSLSGSRGVAGIFSIFDGKLVTGSWLLSNFLRQSKI